MGDFQCGIVPPRIAQEVVVSSSSSSRLEKVGKYNMLMEKVSAAFSVLMVPFMPGMQRIPG
jgi:hypothetical protein